MDSLSNAVLTRNWYGFQYGNLSNSHRLEYGINYGVMYTRTLTVIDNALCHGFEPLPYNTVAEHTSSAVPHRPTATRAVINNCTMWCSAWQIRVRTRGSPCWGADCRIRYAIARGYATRDKKLCVHKRQGVGTILLRYGHPYGFSVTCAEALMLTPFLVLLAGLPGRQKLTSSMVREGLSGCWLIFFFNLESKIDSFPKLIWFLC